MTGAGESASVLLTRGDIIAGLREVGAQLQREGTSAVLQLIGGAAIALAIDSGRRATRDVDGVFAPSAAVLAAAQAVARRRSWPDDWLNDSAAQFLPSGFGRSAEWVLAYEDDALRIEVGSAEMLLAMKLYAAQRRHAREAEDLALLFAVVGIRDVDAAEALYGEFYPGDEFTPRLARLVEAILRQPLPVPDRPRVVL